MGRSTLTRIAGPGPLRRLLAVAAVALATANCSTNPQKLAAGSGNGLDPKYGVKASPRLYNEGDVIPKGGGRRFSGKPYVVAGHTYVPREDARGYVREGLASWYGAAFHGRMTANGEVFDRLSIAAAHPTLPLPSYARVTNLQNGYSMVVRVNDRGPYHAGRVMDVSEEVARALDFHRKGTERVRVEYVGKASVAGSDDRKLLASLRTDGRPAGRNVMVADLGPAEEPERYAKPARPALAFKPAVEADEAGEAPAAPPARTAPVVLASAAVHVPAAVQPTAERVRAFRAAPVRVASLEPRAGRADAPASTITAARPSAAPAPIAQGRAATAPVRPGPAKPADTRTARAPTIMPSPDKLAMTRLIAGMGAKGGAAGADRGGPGQKHALGSPGKTGSGTRLAGIY